MLEFWPIVLTVSGIATAGLFARAVRGHFVSQKLPPAMKGLVALSYLTLFAYLFALWTGGAPLWQRLVGLGLQMLAATLFNWARTTTLDSPFTAAFDTDEPKLLVKAGPYQFVRHPFYVSLYFILDRIVGRCERLDGVVLSIAISASYVFAAMLEEKKFEQSTLAADYQSYANNVGFFLPRLSALAKVVRLDGRRAAKKIFSSKAPITNHGRESAGRFLWRSPPFDDIFQPCGAQQAFWRLSRRSSTSLDASVAAADGGDTPLLAPSSIRSSPILNAFHCRIGVFATLSFPRLFVGER